MSSLQQLISTRPCPLWLDASAYAERLLAQGRAPWLNVTECVAWYRKSTGLLQTDVVALPLAPLVAAWLQTHTTLRDAMATKQRTLHPLKTLLADEALRDHIAELLTGLRASYPDTVLVLVLPAPGRWVAEAFATTHVTAEDIEIGDDEVDSASMYMADFLRRFGDRGVDAVLLQEDAAAEPQTASRLECYQSLLNVAQHYRWEIGLHLPGRLPDALAGALGAFTFVIAAEALAGLCSGLELSADFWAGAAAAATPQGGFRFSRIPADGQPETVLNRLATLR